MKNICFQMSRKAWLAMVMVLCLSFPALAQKITVSGTVTDNTGEPLIGASVLVKGTSQGTATDIDGNFRLDVASNGTLVVSYVGYNTQEVAVNGQTKIDIQLSENSVVLGEVVAIGYGVVKKSDATGSVAVVKPDDVEAGMATSAQDLLVGASPGVVVTTNGGDPSGNANIRIRGGSSLNANNDPLIVIDGVPMQGLNNDKSGTNALTMVNPQNIESMTILKDASATAIYGSRASNGVIIITTKKGSSGKPQINFSANWHLNTPRKTLDMMNASQLSAIIEQYGSDKAKQLLAEENANTDWQDEVLRTSFSQDYSLSVGGTAGFLPYRVNASYTNNQGILKTSDMQRTTVGFNLNPKFFNGKLSINANAQGSYVRTSNADTGAIGGAIGFSPTYPVYKDYETTGDAGRTMYNGFFNVMQTTGNPELQAGENPLQLLKNKKSIGTTLSSNGNLQIDYALHLLTELHFNLNLGYEVSEMRQKTTIDQNSIMAWRSKYMDGAGSVNKWYQLQRNTMLNFYVNYRNDFKAIKSAIDVMAGYEWQKFSYFGSEYEHINTLGYYNNWTGGLYNNGVYNLNIDPATEGHIGKAYNDAPINRWGDPLQLISFFGRLNWTVDDTYLLTFTLRDDGTSRFSKDNRWGLFPSLALGWKFSNMPCFEPVRDWWNDFKIRFGWGQTGQQETAGQYFPYRAIYQNSYQNGFQYLDPNGSGEWINPLFPGSYNPDLKWETTTTWNVGVDLAWLNNRITFTADWYRRITTDLLAFVTTAAASTENMMWRNIGAMENNGVEVTLGAKPVVTKDFTWSTAFNVSVNKNKITKLTGDSSNDRMGASPSLPSGTGQTILWQIVGQPAFSFVVYEQVYDKNGDPLPGQYVDQNGDGIINSDDMITYHSKDPKATFTWNNNFNWKNWDLGISLRANVGNYVYNGPKYANSRIYNVSAATYQLSNLLNDTFLFENPDPNLALSSYFVENASFIRCDNITLGYTFNNLFKDRLNLRLFGAVQNPFVITKYSGIDPEVFSGVDNDCYPRPITVTLGLVATF